MTQKQQGITDLEQRRAEVSRRTFLRQSVRGAAAILSGVIAAGAGLAATAAEAKAKVSKAVARYRHYPNKGRACGGCAHYRFPFGCEVVQAPVAFHGWCRFHTPRG